MEEAKKGDGNDDDDDDDGNISLLLHRLPSPPTTLPTADMVRIILAGAVAEEG